MGRLLQARRGGWRGRGGDVQHAGKRKGWSKAAAVAAGARMLIEAADAHGYELRGGAADGGGCGTETNADLSRLMDYAVRVAPGPTGAGAGAGAGAAGSDSFAHRESIHAETGTDLPALGVSAATAAAQKRHASSIRDALASYLRACDVVGGVDACFGIEGAKIDDVSGAKGVAAATEKARELAGVLRAWASDTPSSEDGRSAMLDTWATRRRRRMCGYVYSRVVLGMDVDDTANLLEIENSALGLTVPSVAKTETRVSGCSGSRKDREGTVSPGDARTLASLGREAVRAAEAAAALATAPLTTARDQGTDLSRLDAWDSGSGEIRFERCFFLYGTLMFFVFRVRVKDLGRIKRRR